MLIAYTDADRAMPVGEFVQQIEEDEDHVGIPVSAFIRAYAQVRDHDDARSTLISLAADAAFARKHEDLRHSVFVMLPLTESDAVEVGEHDARWPGRGQVIREAEKHVAYVDDQPTGPIIASCDLPPDVHSLPPAVVYLDLSAGWDEVGSLEIPG